MISLSLRSHLVANICLGKQRSILLGPILYYIKEISFHRYLLKEKLVAWYNWCLVFYENTYTQLIWCPNILQGFLLKTINLTLTAHVFLLPWCNSRSSASILANLQLYFSIFITYITLNILSLAIFFKLQKCFATSVVLAVLPYFSALQTSLARVQCLQLIVIVCNSTAFKVHGAREDILLCILKPSTSIGTWSNKSFLPCTLFVYFVAFVT